MEKYIYKYLQKDNICLVFGLTTDFHFIANFRVSLRFQFKVQKDVDDVLR